MKTGDHSGVSDRSAENSAVRKEEREPSYNLTAHA